MLLVVLVVVLVVLVVVLVVLVVVVVVVHGRADRWRYEGRTGARRAVQRPSRRPLLACGLEPLSHPDGLMRRRQGHQDLGEGR